MRKLRLPHGGGLVLFDAGTGAQVAPTAGLITRNDLWKAAGIDPAEVTTIVMTHLHLDHFFGLMAKDTNAPIFPKAQIYVAAGEYKYWMDPAVTSGPAKRLQSVFPTWSNIRQFEGHRGCAGSARHRHARPYPRSHQLPLGLRQPAVDRAGGRHQHAADWIVAFDVDPTVADATKRKMFDRVIADKVTVTGYHYGVPGAGTIGRDGNGYVFTPVSA